MIDPQHLRQWKALAKPFSILVGQTADLSGKRGTLEVVINLKTTYCTAECLLDLNSFISLQTASNESLSYEFATYENRKFSREQLNNPLKHTHEWAVPREDYSVRVSTILIAKKVCISLHHCTINHSSKERVVLWRRLKQLQPLYFLLYVLK